MKLKFIGLVVVVILFVIGLGVFMNKQSSAPSKYDDFAKALKTEEAQFYGAFWCPHCKAVKELFGNAKRYLPYIECSNPDQTVTKVCVDNKIESYPTWKFKNGITIASKGDPLICPIRSEKPYKDAICDQTGSQFYRTWIFPEYKFSIKSPTDPISKDGVWKFAPEAEVTGETPLEFLAAQIGFNLPK
jgi:thiol-disulfide isomerase/thioredoxin